MTAKKSFSLILILFAISSLFSQKFSIQPAPSWIQPIDVPVVSKVSKYDVNGGLFSSLIDYQTNLIKNESYAHLAYHIVSNSGVEKASQILIEYDSSYSQIHFHYLYIWRKGKKIDKTNELSFETLNNENGLLSNIYSGKISAYDILEDIRVNDKLEYAYTKIGFNPIYNNLHFKLIPLIDNNPVDLLSYIITYPDDNTYVSKCVDCENYELKTNTKKGITTTSIQGKNLDAADIDENYPPGYFPFSHYTLSNTKTWKQVNEWALDIFSLETKPNFSNVYEEIFSGKETRDEKIDAIINYVQTDIRYMGIESGIGNVKPFHPEQVVNQRYGDCKDKSLLLSLLLNDIGIKNCHPALVSTELLSGLDNIYPSGKAFDHCITYLEVDGKEYWIDPTFSVNGGTYKTKKIPNYKRALVVAKNTKSLRTIPNNDKYSRLEINETLNLTSFTKDGYVKIVTDFYGLNADYMRANLENLSRREITDQFKAAQAYNYPNISDNELVEIYDNEIKNHIKIVEQYTIQNFWNKKFIDGALVNTFKYEPIELTNYISHMSCEPRKLPVPILTPNKFKQTTNFILPQTLKPNTLNKEYINKAFHFKHKITPINVKEFKVSYEFETVSDEIAAEHFLKACNHTNEISKNTAIYISFPVPE